MVTKLPIGSQMVIEALIDDQIYTLEEIQSKLPDLELGTIRYAIRRLLEIGIIQSIPDLKDMRTVKYRLQTESALNVNLAKLPTEVVSKIHHLFQK